jgi:hypothetical protein
MHAPLAPRAYCISSAARCVYSTSLCYDYDHQFSSVGLYFVGTHGDPTVPMDRRTLPPKSSVRRLGHRCHLRASTSTVGSLDLDDRGNESSRGYGQWPCDVSDKCRMLTVRIHSTKQQQRSSSVCSRSRSRQHTTPHHTTRYSHIRVQRRTWKTRVSSNRIMSPSPSPSPSPTSQVGKLVVLGKVETGGIRRG